MIFLAIVITLCPSEMIFIRHLILSCLFIVDCTVTESYLFDSQQPNVEHYGQAL